jgi:hypothetical protein
MVSFGAPSLTVFLGVKNLIYHIYFYLTTTSGFYKIFLRQKECLFWLMGGQFLKHLTGGKTDADSDGRYFNFFIPFFKSVH